MTSQFKIKHLRVSQHYWWTFKSFRKWYCSKW